MTIQEIFYSKYMCNWYGKKSKVHKLIQNVMATKVFPAMIICKYIKAMIKTEGHTLRDDEMYWLYHMMVQLGHSESVNMMLDFEKELEPHLKKERLILKRSVLTTGLFFRNS